VWNNLFRGPYYSQGRALTDQVGPPHSVFCLYAQPHPLFLLAALEFYGRMGPYYSNGPFLRPLE
jgi:hypothetical protein